MGNDTLAIRKRNGARPRTFRSRNSLPIFASVSHPAQQNCKQLTLVANTDQILLRIAIHFLPERTEQRMTTMRVFVTGATDFIVKELISTRCRLQPATSPRHARGPTLLRLSPGRVRDFGCIHSPIISVLYVKVDSRERFCLCL